MAFIYSDPTRFYNISARHFSFSRDRISVIISAY